VVVANDVRVFLDSTRTLKFLATNPYHASDPTYGVTSRRLAYLAAEVYAANGFTVYLMEPSNDKAMLTTPELSYLIRQLRASGGINLSASHNPPDDNGVKVYDENGGQYLPPYDQMLTDMARDIREVKHMPFSTAVQQGLIRDVPPELLESYRRLYLDRARERGLASQRQTRVVFTPLSGCGGRTVGDALSALNYTIHVPPRQGPDGTFSAIPLKAPNPEVKEATEPAKAAADAFGAHLVLASDPDADRIGAEVYHGGEWVHLSGNQIATILAYFLLLDPEGPRVQGGVYQSIVTTLATRAIAERAGCEPIVTDLLVGFKYVGKAVQELANTLGPDAPDTALLAFAAEESHGYLDTPQLRDKDAMAGALSLARLHERLAEQGRTLLDYLDAIYADIGQFGDRGRSLTILGSEGVREIRRVMEVLRRTRPSEFGGVPVQEYIDHWDTERFGEVKGATDREARNILVFRFPGGQITFRPSGTEPKLKFYVQTTGPSDGATAQGYADRLSDAVYQQVLGVLGRQLHPAFISLPDVIPLNSKLEIQRVVEEDLRHMVNEPGRALDFVADWLDERVSALIPGESAWEIARPAVRACVQDWTPDEVRQVEAVFAAHGKR
jgi:phosphoglucomutase/phosphomannomutase